MRETEFNEFVLPHLKKSSRGPSKKISFFKLFHYILKLIHIGCQWQEIPIAKDSNGKPEIHYTSIFKAFSFWIKHGCFDKIFEASVLKLFKAGMLDTSVLQVMVHVLLLKKGDNLGYNGHKRTKGDKVV
ncbi:hypothetical protein [Rickettsia endosymbiont of Gonocerus acuteangulatus]|uniref:hypothetical protein n=1 Tax=Rickettsia endosymbiont of Gonocerus acuteangulatus TaxID=3066266 RepID=UPI003132A926